MCVCDVVFAHTPLEAVPVWSGLCPLSTASPLCRAQGHPESAARKQGGWERTRAATGTGRGVWRFPLLPPSASDNLYRDIKSERHIGRYRETQTDTQRQTHKQAQRHTVI